MATTSLTQGVSARVVQERLGRSDISTTLGIYSHLMPGVREQAAEELEAAMFDDNRDDNPGVPRRNIIEHRNGQVVVICTVTNIGGWPKSASEAGVRTN